MGSSAAACEGELGAFAVTFHSERTRRLTARRARGHHNVEGARRARSKRARARLRVSQPWLLVTRSLPPALPTFLSVTFWAGTAAPTGLEMLKLVGVSSPADALLFVAACRYRERPARRGGVIARHGNVGRPLPHAGARGLYVDLGAIPRRNGALGGAQLEPIGSAEGVAKRGVAAVREAKTAFRRLSQRFAESYERVAGESAPRRGCGVGRRRFTGEAHREIRASCGRVRLDAHGGF